MKQFRLKNTTDNFFLQAWELYEIAFPKEERRLFDTQVRVMENPNYHFDIMVKNDQLIGFNLWWNLDSVRYIDHLATAVNQRNKGFGKLILKEFIEINDKPILFLK